MKNLLKPIAFAILISACYGCSVEPIDTQDTAANDLVITQEIADTNTCTGQDPEVRITNNGTVAISLDVLNDDDDVVGFVHNLLPGETSIWISFPPGDTLFSVTNDVVQDVKVVHSMNTCMIYDMEIDSNNELTSTPPEQL